MQLRLDHISKNVGADTHLYDLSLNLEPGLNVLLGPTQAGKTSIMRIMAGLDKPTTGRVLIDDRDVTGVAVQKRSVAFVYQQFVNYPSFTVFDNIASPLRLKGSSQDQIKQQVQSVAEMMHIDHLLDRLPAALSGGQQQRTAIARALVKQAELLLLDEPLVNLDYKLREELRAEMLEIFIRRNSIVVYATTEPLEALMLGGVTSVMDAGRLLQTGATLEVYHRPLSVRVAEVFSDPPMNLIPAQIETVSGGLQARLSSGMIFALPDHMQRLVPGSYKLGIRANHAKLTSSSTSINLPAKVDLADISGSETFVHASSHDLRVVVQLTGVHSFSIQQEITVALEPSRLFAFDAGGVLQASPNRNSSVAAKVVA
jgi:glycerol transport system ATP-binding protein